MLGDANYLEGEIMQSNLGISTFSIGSNMIEILGDYSVGSSVGILIKPEDIILSRETIRTSARNMIKTKIIKIIDHDEKSGTGGVVDVHLKADSFHIISRVTKQARADLDLQINEDVFAIFKASSPQIIREE